MLQYKRSSLDGLEDAEKKHYMEKGGVFLLGVDDSGDERVQGLIKNRNEALAEKEALEKKVRDLEKSNGGGEALASAKTQIAELEKKLVDAGKSGKFSEDQVSQIKKDIEAEYKTKLSERETELQMIRDRVARAQLESSIKDALTKAGAKKGAFEMMTAFLRDRGDVVEGEIGVSEVRVKKLKGEGHEVSTKDGERSVFKTMSELVEELKVNPDYGFVFEGSKASGGGAEKTGTNGQAPKFDGDFSNVRARSDLNTPAKKAGFLGYLREKTGDDQKAQDEYFALPAVREEP